MKKQGILNRDIATILARLGHTDTIVIGDCGLPIPPGVTCIDLTLKIGTPDFLSVLSVVMEDMEVELMTLAEEIKQKNSSIEAAIKRYNCPIDYIAHDLFKKKTEQAKVIIRTGEATPYANVILRSGVIF